MPFQLVLATDDEIVVWHTDHGHIFSFAVDEPGSGMRAAWSRDIDEAPVRAVVLADEARRFAEEEARSRHLIR